MFLSRRLKSVVNSSLLLQSEESIYWVVNNHHYLHSQKSSYVDVYMKWKKDSYFDSIDHISRSMELKPIIALKNCIVREPDACIPISAVSKRGLEFDVPVKVALFLRQYPSIFQEFEGPEFNLPWFRLTPGAVLLDKEERAVYEDWRSDLRLRLKKFILMSREKVLPFKIIQGMQWNLGLPDDFLKNPDVNLDGSFRIVELEDGLKGLGVVCEAEEEKILSVMQKNAMKRGILIEQGMEMEFPIFPSRGLRLRKKIENWLEMFQRVPYVSPYDDSSNLDPSSDVSEKRLVGVLHELLSISVEHAMERKNFIFLKKYLGLPQKVHKAFERHPHMFYLSMKNNTCTAILKEAYCSNKLAIQKHPLLKVRKKYINLIKESELILKKNRRPVNSTLDRGSQNLDLDLDCADENDNVEITECSPSLDLE